MNENRCPSCGCSQPDGVLCVDDTAALVTMLAAVPHLLEQLDIAASKQAKVASGGKAGKGSAHERSPVNWGVVAVRDSLLVELARWGDDVPAIRRHPDAGNAVSDIGHAIKNAYRAIDRAADRKYLGRCMNPVNGFDCQQELWVRPTAGEVRCQTCGYEHNVANRRMDMLDMAADMLCSVKEASSYVGEIGHIRVTEASIRGYIHRGRITYRPGKLIRLGDLLAVVIDEGERRSA